MLTKENKNFRGLPEEIKKAILAGYDVFITKDVHDGVISAKITYHKVKTLGKIEIGRTGEPSNNIDF